MSEPVVQVPVNRQNFLTTVPALSPLSSEYRNFWQGERRKTIEGMWSGGWWMPGTLYMYVNHLPIKKNKSKHSKVKITALPDLRDIDWERHFIYNEARGFSGFRDDDEYTCRRDFAERGYAYKNVKENRIVEPEEEDLMPGGLFDKEGNLREGFIQVTYEPARSYLRRLHKKELGPPLYQNQAKNVVDIEGRGGGKSYTMAAFIVHNFLSNGAVSAYEFYNEFPSSETLVGAIDSGYSADLLEKARLMLNNLKGGYSTRGVYYPPPFFQTMTGSFKPNKEVRAEWIQKKEGKEIPRGSGSTIKHRSFWQDVEAGNGTRPGLTILEEIGLFETVQDVLGHMKEATMNGDYKFGTIYMGGTGGSMDGGATEAAMEIFENPEQYDCLTFEDHFEGRTEPIGMFIPATYTLNDYKDDNGNTNVAQAEKALKRRRETLKKGTDKKPYLQELQYQPLSYTEAFLVSGGNLFPTAELKSQQGHIQTSNEPRLRGVNGQMVLNSAGLPEFVPDTENELTPASYPVKQGKHPKGCITIWGEIPDPSDPPKPGIYIGGTDPYAQDKSETSVSLGSTFIYKMPVLDEDAANSDTVVAEWTGRPERAEEFYEQTRLLCMLYNARLMYENQYSNLRVYFEHRKSLHLLQYTPTYLKATANSKTLRSRTYGLHMTSAIRHELELYLRDWLLETWEGENLRNLHKILSIPLLKELINYNDRGNFDRVDAMLMVMAHRNMLLHIKRKEAKDEVPDWSEVPPQERPFFERPLFVNPREQGVAERNFAKIRHRDSKNRFKQN